MTSVPYGDTFLLVGGWNELTFEWMETIFMYDPYDERFVLLPETLRQGRGDHGAIMVEAQAFPQCD